MSRPRFILWPGDKVVAIQDIKPDYYSMNLRRHVLLGTVGIVQFSLFFEDATWYRVHWQPDDEQKRNGWYHIMGDHSPDDVGYLLEEK